MVMQLTGTDIDVGARLVSALVRHVAAQVSAQAPPLALLSAADLLAQARMAAPRDATLARALPLGLAPKLQFVTAFCAHYGYPDLAQLVVTAAPQQTRELSALGACDWSACDERLAAFVRAAHASVPARYKPRAERPADVAWYAYFRSHRAACDGVSEQGKQEIINLIMAGLDPESALARVLEAQAREGAAIV